MTLTRHTQVENLANLLHLRRSTGARQSHRTVEEAYADLIATILSAPAQHLALVPIATEQSVVALGSRRSRAA